MSAYLSADELYRYLHISKRKLKLLLKTLTSISISGVRYCSKTEFIAHCASPKMLAKPSASVYRNLIVKFVLLNH